MVLPVTTAMILPIHCACVAVIAVFHCVAAWSNTNNILRHYDTSKIGIHNNVDISVNNINIADTMDTAVPLRRIRASSRNVGKIFFL